MRGARGALVLVAFAVACGGGGTEPATTGGAGGGGGPPPPPGGGGGSTSNSISVIDNGFDPASTTLPINTTVTWTFTTSTGHNVTFDSGPSSNTQTSGTFQRSFPAAGSFPYSCTLHPGMNGTIIVQ